MTKLSVIVFVTAICLLVGHCQGIISETLGKIVLSQLRESAGSGGLKQQGGADRDWDSGDDYGQYKESSQQRQQSHKSSSNDGIYSMQDSRQDDSRRGSSSGRSWNNEHQHWD